MVSKGSKSAAPSFKQYREPDGLFYFKLLDAQGALLLQSTGFTAPRDAAQAMMRLQREGNVALEALSGQLASRGDPAAVSAALQSFSEQAD
ncbi:hypothetical protein D9M69_694460 [compost metagenome]